MSWLVIFGTIVISWPIVIFMNKRLPVSEIYTTVVFGLLVQALVDTYASFEYKAWGFFKMDRAEFKALWIILGIYPIFSSMIINWFPYHKAWWKKFLYLIAWAAFSTGYEWLSVKSGIIWHKNWNLLYSFMLYPAIYYMLTLHVRFYKRLRQKNTR